MTTAAIRRANLHRRTEAPNSEQPTAQGLLINVVTMACMCPLVKWVCSGAQEECGPTHFRAPPAHWVKPYLSSHIYSYCTTNVGKNKYLLVWYQRPHPRIDPWVRGQVPLQKYKVEGTQMFMSFHNFCSSL